MKQTATFAATLVASVHAIVYRDDIDASNYTVDPIENYPFAIPLF